MDGFAGYIIAVLIGMIMGLLGGGGSILTVPVFVYLLGIKPVLATAYSLFVVGSAALVGGIEYVRKEQVNLKVVAVFALPSLIAVYLTRKFLIPAIPESLFTLGNTEITRDLAIMTFFGLIMVFSAISMIRSRAEEESQEIKPAALEFNYSFILLEGAIVGLLTGIVGAGGGFIIVPALVLFTKLPMKMAVGTSLLIIAAKSLIGFLGDLSEQPIAWDFLLPFAGCTILGIFAGSYFATYIPAYKLKKGFGYFVLVMGTFILAMEIFK